MTREGTGSALISSTTAAHCSLVLLLLLQRRSAPQIEGRTKHLTTAKRTRRTTTAASASATRPPTPRCRVKPGHGRAPALIPRGRSLSAPPARLDRRLVRPCPSLPPSFGLSVSLYCERALGPLIAVRGTTSMRATAKLSCSAVVPRGMRARQGPRSGRLRGVAATRLAPARQRHDAVRARPQCLWTME